MVSMIGKVGIIMGSKSDLPVMQDAADVLKELGIEFEITVVSAHRTPEECLIMPQKHTIEVLE